MITRKQFRNYLIASFFIALALTLISWKNVIDEKHLGNGIIKTFHGYPLTSLERSEKWVGRHDVWESLKITGTVLNFSIYFLVSAFIIYISKFINKFMLQKNFVSKKQLKRVWIFSFLGSFILLIISTYITTFFQPDWSCPQNVACSPPPPSTLGFPMIIYNGKFLYPNMVINLLIYFIISFLFINVIYMFKNKMKK